MKLEEERFFSTIEAGIQLFSKELESTTDIFSGEIAFKLYDTYGFPLDLTEDMLREKKIALDREGFERKMQTQKEQSKAAWKGTGDAATSGDFRMLKEKFGENEFVGYEETSVYTKVLALLDEHFRETERIEGRGWVMLEQTPFYAESGGQTGDTGELKGDDENIKVLDTKKFLDLNLSEVEGVLKVGDEVIATVDENRREIAKHHSATHLLHAALRKLLGEHIFQAGSLVEANRLRFDFSHPGPMSRGEIKEVEAWVNDKIGRGIPAKTEVMSAEAAKNSGAMALFGEKYGDEVRVVSMGDVSVELCGGTHVDSTAEIGLFMITKESGVSAGVRRIEAVCGAEAVRSVNLMREELSSIREELKNPKPIAGIIKLKEQIKTLKGELAAMVK
jgi:alanyl-tRNA synthetase